MSTKLYSTFFNMSELGVQHFLDFAAIIIPEFVSRRCFSNLHTSFSVLQIQITPNPHTHTPTQAWVNNNYPDDDTVPNKATPTNR